MSNDLQVLVIADTSQADHALFEALYLFVGSRQFLLKGLFIEDEALLRAIRLPQVQEVLYTGEVRMLTPDQLASDYLDSARRLQRALGKVSEQLGNASSFEVVQGSHAAELARAAAGADFVVLTRPQLPGALHMRAGLHFEPLIAQATSLLVVNEPWSSGQCVVVAWRDDASRGALAIGAAYARRAGLALAIVAPLHTPRPTLADLDGATWSEIKWSEDELVALCEGRDARLLILRESDMPDMAQLLPKLIDKLPCSVLRLA